ncbi:MAG TPA: PKD domain-containing protein, partial [Clostridia bacterium]|nr:PKD domain-containing protein [Clostridia bacterium]
MGKTSACSAIASFTCNTTSGSAPLTVAFSNTSTGNIDSYSWDFNGDGTPDNNTSELVVNFTYNTPGTYNAM